ncbi:hypothetical protein BB8028_0003g15960 [Beauveria bassiana]|uniref:Uncharacterized protein n=1 Tax=Beauveria bassiana TaxID=176275 RepID=A0A2S7Y9Y1_BEABA|nr:hypothetical protein BB8028_0003g15960 [Beauveria bassiana]
MQKSPTSYKKGYLIAMGTRKNPTDIINRAQSNGFKSGLHHEEDKKTGLQEYDEKTLGAQDQVLEKYAIWAFKYLNNKLVTVFEEFEAMLLYQARGRLSERPTARSLKASAKSFNGGFKRRTGNSVPAETIAEINLWIGGPLTSEEGSGVTNIERPKYNYKPQDLDRNLKALWSRSDIGVRHERERFQFHFLVLLFCDTGARREGLFKAGIPYKDIHLVLERQDGVPRFFFQVAQRTVKNNKDPKNRRFGVTGREHRLLRYNAVFLLLHFAIADGALDHDFFTQILNGKGDGSIEWKEAALELPVCRSVDRNGCLTSEAMTFAVFERVLKKVFMGEYNFDRASMHMIRRDLGKQLDNRYTATERSQHVLHNDNRIFGQSYVAFASSCDGLAAFMRETADHTAVEYFQGLHRFHQPGMPVRLPAALLAKVETSAELAEYDNKIHSAVSPNARTEAQRARKNAVKRLRKKTLQEYREECLKTLRKDRLINGCHAANNTLDPLNEVFPEKRRVSEAMTSDLEEFSVIEDALRLLTMSSKKYH